MNMHDGESSIVLRYVQGELEGQELEEFSRHLKTCPECKGRVEEEIALSDLFRQTRPLYTAPDDLRERIAALINQETRNAQPVSSRRRGAIAQILEVKAWQWSTWRWCSLMAATVVLAVGAILSLGFFREFRAQNYVHAAVIAHKDNIEGRKPFECHSESPVVVKRWADQRVPFSFELPVFDPNMPNSSPYRIAGARLIAYHGHAAVIIAYRMQTELVSLLVAPGPSATVAGGKEIHDGALLFHYRTDGGFNVITWKNHGLSYALVSSVSGPAQQSCLVCHATNMVR